MRILLADDHGGIIEATRRLLQPPEFEVIATVNSSSAALKAVMTLRPDCAVLDVSLPDLSGLELARRLRATGSTTHVIFLTVHEDAELVAEACAAGARGYVVKSRIGVDLKRALRSLHQGGIFVSPLNSGSQL